MPTFYSETLTQLRHSASVSSLRENAKHLPLAESKTLGGLICCRSGIYRRDNPALTLLAIECGYAGDVVPVAALVDPRLAIDLIERFSGYFKMNSDCVEQP